MQGITRIIVACSALIITPHALTSDGPKCIGKICLDDNRVETKDVSRIYGRTYAFFGTDTVYSCYRVGKNSFLRVGHMDRENSVTDVLLTKNEPCPPTKKAAYISKPLKSEAGIGIGSSRSEVKARYGEPREIVRGSGIYGRWLNSATGLYHDPQNLSELWMYASPTRPYLIRAIGFDGEKVVSIYPQD